MKTWKLPKNFALKFLTSIDNSWHYFRYHFEHVPDHPFGISVLNGLSDISTHLPGYGQKMIERLASHRGRVKNLRDLEQLYQALAEAIVIRRLVSWPWSDPVTIETDAQAPGSKRDVDVLLTTADWRVGIEIKTPGNLDHRRRRTASSIQLTARSVGYKAASDLALSSGSELVTPRDCIKDFVDSTNLKCSGFRAADSGFRSVLVLVWDDFVNEAVNPLLNPESGLFTPHSFARPSSGGPDRFSAVDGVVVTRHELQLIDVSGHDDSAANYDALAWEGPRMKKPIGLIINPTGLAIPTSALDPFGTTPVQELDDPVWRPNAGIVWHRDPRLGMIGGVLGYEPPRVP